MTHKAVRYEFSIDLPAHSESYLTVHVACAGYECRMIIMNHRLCHKTINKMNILRSLNSHVSRKVGIPATSGTVVFIFDVWSLNAIFSCEIGLPTRNCLHIEKKLPSLIGEKVVLLCVKRMREL